MDTKSAHSYLASTTSPVSEEWSHGTCFSRVAAITSERTRVNAKMNGEKITLTNEKSDVATVSIADVKQSNGVIHVIDTVMLPKV